MKKFSLLILILAACNSNKEENAQKTQEKPLSVQEAIKYPVSSVYTPTWIIGESKNAVKVLDMYNAWDAGNLETLKTALADSVEMFFANGDILTGARDSVIEKIRAYRKEYAEIKSTVYSFTSLNHPDTKEKWVVVWVKENNTSTKGKKDSIELHESWRINNDGMIDLCFQYARSFKASKK
jgi:hypothetical protein